MSALTEYLKSISKELTARSATENTYRPALKTLLESFGDGIMATNEPKRIACGAPDFKLSRKGIPIGSLETKDIGSDLDEMERGKGPHGDQFVRYRNGLPNWILTDYIDFRWFVNGKKRLAVRIAELDAKGKVKVIPECEQKLAQILQAFFKEPALTVATAKDLAVSMAHMTRIVRDLISEALKTEVEETERRRVKEEMPGYGISPSAHGPWLEQWLAAFREVLIPDLDAAQFADMFAQTLAYGLFASRVHLAPGKSFSRESAAFTLPKTNPFLRKLFQEIAGDMPDLISWAVDDIVELLKHADMTEILKDFGKGKGKEDPVVHFYETFLAAYDPKMRELRGVYYTPEPVVSYIVRSIDYLLRTRFNRPKGLADENTLILDPATGTGTFLYFVIEQIHQAFAKQKGSWDDYVANHLLNRIFGFELLMAPYAVAHLKLGMELEQTGYEFGSDQRLGIYLTNTLEEAAKKSEQIFAGWVAEEANAASKIKNDLPIMVILGNPPYSNYGRMNRGKWILSLLEDYKKDLHEKKLNLDDDFIKFIRFAQWRIEKTGHGIIGLITNNVYLDGITHRRMREYLLKTFNEIYVLNLHGNLRKKEMTPEGLADKNVFDIQQGVAISLFVKIPNRIGCRLFHADLWGERKVKYETLWEKDAEKIHWMDLWPASPYFFFVPKNLNAEAEYTMGWNVANVFTEQNTGIQTKRDELFIDFDKEKLGKRFEDIAAHNADTAYLKEKYRLENSSGWNVSKLNGLSYHQKAILHIFYRPFDVRWIYFDPIALGRARESTMRHMIAGKNLGLITLRINEGGDLFVCLVTQYLIEKGSLPRGNYSIFPLYLYPNPRDEQGELSPESGCRPNLNPTFLKALAEKLKLPQTEPYGLPEGITPEDIFNYSYAVFHSPTYRTRYAEFLKIDFPRLPLTSDLKLFCALASKGSELVALHLLESPKVNDFLTSFPEKGDNAIEKVLYTDKDRRVWINKTQYFGGVPKSVWEFQIGGYQVCEKWLKDRKGRNLAYDDIQHYQKIVVALSETIRLMAAIDKLIPSWPIT